MTDHDSDDRSLRTIAGDPGLGFSRVRPQRDRQPHAHADGPDDASSTTGNDGFSGFEVASSGVKELGHRQLLAIGLFVLLALTLFAGTVVRLAVGLDGFLLAAADTGGLVDAPVLHRVDSALATLASRVRQLTLVAGALAGLGCGLAALIVTIRRG